MQDFDSSRARLSKKELFKRFSVTNSGPLAKAVDERRISMEDKLLIVKRAEQKLAFSLQQMAYHHVAQGTLAGYPYLVSF